MRAITKNKGFTLIELLVVLAIIGILIALAIVGLQAAQSGQRDTARKDIASQINSQLQAWQANNGTYPTTSQFYAAGGAVGTNFIVNSCSNGTNGITVNGACIGLDGLSFDTTVNACSTNASTPTTQLQLCYDNGSSYTNGYQLGVYLEANNSANGGKPYYIAQ